MAQRQLRAVCFTLNNYTEEEYESAIRYAEEKGSYWIVGREVGDAGTPHLQGYIKLRRRTDFNVVKSGLNPRAHIESSRGTPRQNREYCCKDGNFAEGGELPKGREGSRDELATSFLSALTKGARGISEFAKENPGTWMFSGHTMLRNALSLQTPVARPGVHVQWIYGPPGVGKSRRAHELFPEAYVKEPRTKWWNGYLMEKEVIIDDFGPGGIDINHLLRWFDRYPCIVENKGGMIPLVADKFVVTSNFHPKDIFKWGDEVNPQLPALERRIVLEYMEINYT